MPHSPESSTLDPETFWNVLVIGLSSLLHIFGLFVDVFLPPPSLSPLLTQCDGCSEDCMGAQGWFVGIARHGSVLLSGGWLVTVELRCPSSIQHDAVVTSNFEKRCY